MRRAVQGVHDGTLQFFVEPFELPPGSSFLMVCAENAQGRGPAMAQKLVDIVRSRPVHANFSGLEGKGTSDIKQQVYTRQETDTYLTLGKRKIIDLKVPWEGIC